MRIIVWKRDVCVCTRGMGNRSEILGARPMFQNVAMLRALFDVDRMIGLKHFRRKIQSSVNKLTTYSLPFHLPNVGDRGAVLLFRTFF